MFSLLSISAIAAENGAPCRPVNHDGNSYDVCQFDLRHYTLKLSWKQPDGEPYGSLRNIPRRDGAKTGQLVFATNGGMYQTDRTPLGCMLKMGESLYEQIPPRELVISISNRIGFSMLVGTAPVF